MTSPGTESSYPCTPQSLKHFLCVADRDTLNTLYIELEGHSWVNNSGWADVDVSLENWHGVYANGTEVFALELGSNNLVGEGGFSSVFFSSRISRPYPQSILLIYFVFIYHVPVLAYPGFKAVVSPKEGCVEHLLDECHYFEWLQSAS